MVPPTGSQPGLSSLGNHNLEVFAGNDHGPVSRGFEASDQIDDVALPADDAEGQARLTALAQGLQELGWTDGRNLRIDYRWGAGDTDRHRKYAAELVALAPNVILASATQAVEALRQATRTVPTRWRTPMPRSGCAR
jgi:hypothetical protein